MTKQKSKDDISFCIECNCMTKTTDIGTCGKCDCIKRKEQTPQPKGKRCVHHWQIGATIAGTRKDNEIGVYVWCSECEIIRRAYFKGWEKRSK